MTPEATIRAQGRAAATVEDRPRYSVRCWASRLACAIVLAAACAKLFDLDAFAVSLAQWHLVPTWAVSPLSAGVPLLELSLAGTWLLGLSGRRTRVTLAGFILACSVAFAAETWIFGQPTCRCFGKLVAWNRAKLDAPWILIRNAMLVVMLLYGVALPRNAARRRSAADATDQRQSFHTS